MKYRDAARRNKPGEPLLRNVDFSHSIALLFGLGVQLLITFVMNPPVFLLTIAQTPLDDDGERESQAVPPLTRLSA